MSGHSGCIRLKTKNSWWNRKGHNVQIWLTTGHTSCFFPQLKNVLVLACGFVLSCVEGEGWLMPATGVLPRGNTGLSKRGGPVFPHFCPLNQNPPCVRTRGKGPVL